MDQRLFLALVTERGTETSHTAILARSMGIPAVLRHKPQAPNGRGRMAAVDGESGVLYIDPEEGLLSELENRKRERELLARSLEALKDQKTVTGSGRRIPPLRQRGRDPGRVRGPGGRRGRRGAFSQ